MATQTDPMPTMKDELTTAEAYPVSFAIFALARSHRAVAASLLAELGLFPGQEIMLMQLWDNDGQSQKALAHTLRLDHSTVAKSVRRLRNSGLLDCGKSEADGRVTLIFLTEAGRALRQRTMDAWAELERVSVTGLSLEEQAQFVLLARKIAPNLN